MKDSIRKFTLEDQTEIGRKAGKGEFSGKFCTGYATPHQRLSSCLSLGTYALDIRFCYTAGGLYHATVQLAVQRKQDQRVAKLSKGATYNFGTHLCGIQE